MNRWIKRTALIVSGLAIASVLALTVTSTVAEAAAAERGPGGGWGGRAAQQNLGTDRGGWDNAGSGWAADGIVAGDLNEAEAAGILFMREEEKLARDVYLTLYDQWELATFKNIADSEQKHMDAIARLIDRYGLTDPVTGHDIGEFSDPDLQHLYDQLVAQGSASLEAALKVGAAIEEIDILDLEEYISATDNGDIQRVYENLNRGSENHLRAFVTELTNLGVDYSPQYLNSTAFDQIVTGRMGGGR
jgi:hypothetical protein